MKVQPQVDPAATHSADEGGGGLVRSAVKALQWNYLGVGARTLSSFVIGVVLARLLGPKPFGEVAIAWLVIGLGNLITDFGFGAALIQRRDLSREDVRYAFTVQVGFGVLVTCTVAGLAPWIASLFRQPEAAPVVRALSLIFTVQAFGLTAISLLKRDLAFRRLQTAQVASYLIGYLGVGIPLAVGGCGVWSLVAAQLTQPAILTALAYLSTRHAVGPLFRSGHRELTSFGRKAIGVNVMNWMIGNGDNVIVGQVFGATSLGLYDRAQVLMITPMNGVVSTLQAVLFPTYSRAQNDAVMMRRGYLKSIAIVQLCVAPAFFVAASVPATIIYGLYGARWPAAVPLLVPMALARPFQSLMGLAGPLLWGIGKVERELHVQLAMVLILVPAMFLAARVSMLCVAWTVAAVFVLQCALMTRAAMRAVGCGGAALVRILRGPLLISAITVPAVRLCDQMSAKVLPPPAVLGIDTAAGLAIFALLIVLFPKAILCHEIWEFAAARGWHWLPLRAGQAVSCADAKAEPASFEPASGVEQ